MINPNVIYQRFNNNTTLLNFPYQPVFKDESADYICFTTDTSVTSKFWRIVHTDSYDKEIIDSYLSAYTGKCEIRTNQIQTGPLFDNNFNAYPSLITIPDFTDLPGVSFDASKLISTSDGNGNYLYKKNPIYTDGRYNGRPFLLTIGVPVSNQIKTIDRCLSHIKPLLDAIDSELLVIDTGSTDGTVEICRQYGARVVKFPWCNNMSAARNTGIYNAKGMWYMSIDDDEWFEDVSEIINFFKSGEYIHYNAASYIQRNYTYLSGKTYSDVISYRMTQITPDTHFEGRIHDALIPPKNANAYIFSSYAHHYGFARDSESDNEKYKRNVNLLLYDVYEFPLNLRYNYQLANELAAAKHFDESSAYFLRGISIEQELDNARFGKAHAAALISNAYQKKSGELFWLFDLFKNRYAFASAEMAYFHFCLAEIGLKLSLPYDYILKNYDLYTFYKQKFDSESLTGRANVRTGIDLCINDTYINYTHTIAFCAYMGLNSKEKALNELSIVSADNIEAAPEWFYEHLYMDDGEALRLVAEKSSYMRFDLLCSKLLKGYVNYILREDNLTCNIWQLADVLSCFSIKRIQIFLSQQSTVLTTEFCNKICSAEALAMLQDDTIILPLQLKYFFSYIFEKKYAEAQNEADSLDFFLMYAKTASEFTYCFYNTTSIDVTDSLSIEPELRAACLIWQSCNANSIAIMLDGLKKALEICPEFHKEIKTLISSIKQ